MTKGQTELNGGRIKQRPIAAAHGQACCEGMCRRTFLESTAIASAYLLGAQGAVAGPFEPADFADHYVPVDKKLRPEWVEQLFAKGGPTVYSGKDLDNIAMPIGGICAGQLYLLGDGRLGYWDIFNLYRFSGYGATNYQAPPGNLVDVAQGFALRIETGGRTAVRPLARGGFRDITFQGEYPLAFVTYRDPEVPVEVRLEAFSPFIPLNEEDSALPLTVLEYRLTNRSAQGVKVTLCGWLENAVAFQSGEYFALNRVNRLVRGENFVAVAAGCEELPQPPIRPPIVLADFEGENYGNWVVEGEAFGTGPAKGTLPNQQQVSGFLGKGLVNTYLGGSDRLKGRLISPPFKIERRFISFLIGGGNHPGKTCVQLVVDGTVVRSATGKNNERLEWVNWNVAELEGKEARIEIIDDETTSWGHINVDQIELRDLPRPELAGPLGQQRDYGTMALVLLEEPSKGIVLALDLAKAPSMEQTLFERLQRLEQSSTEASRRFPESLVAAIGKEVTLRPGEEAKLRFAIAWCFPNLYERGALRRNYYANRFADAIAVAQYLSTNYDRLAGQTRLWHATWYDATLPYWLLDRLFAPVCNLATGTCQWWANGRFWAYEGVGCCHGTCSHVWNYAHAMARLFPRLERSVRQMQDLDPKAGFVEETGMIRFRGEDWQNWAGDGQAGSILKAYREHQMSPDDGFLRQNWPRIKKALQFLMNEDGDENGILEGRQHNTYDIDFFGPNTMVGSLYLAALRAGEEMAKEMGDEEFASRCRRLFERGREYTVRELFNGEYFIQKVDLKQHPRHQYADGCLADQVFGQSWAHQVGLGYIYPPEMVRSALKAIWVYNWAPDIGPQNKAHPPQRWFARPGQAGLFMCTWPKSKHLGPESVLYRDEVWTGTEYQVASHMVWEGMLLEALAICRAVHERYQPASHNPWNEVECGDHYARALASYGVFLALCGYEYHGPRGHIGFAPRLAPEKFRAAFTAAEGWGTFAQERSNGRQRLTIEPKWGQLSLSTLALELPENARASKLVAQLDGREVEASFSQQERRVLVSFPERLAMKAGSKLEVTVTL
ncbi:MAG: GH116 family glycosyl hydrolase [Thermoguttaceae bacterium]|nr:GH116 family glycosyl hydrolase [Thermoguttaceae bacterium]